MRMYFYLGIVLSSVGLKAETFLDTVQGLEGNLIRFQSGRIAYLDRKGLTPPLKKRVSVTLDKNSTMVSYRESDQNPAPGEEKINSSGQNSPPQEFAPSIVPSEEEARNIFNRSNPNYRRLSECSDRAHIWAHDEFKRTGTTSRKVFIFFTASYINSVRFKWWFHVAPLYQVATPDGVEDMVMDFRYTDRPTTIKEWTDQFVYTRRPCKLTTQFSEYDVNPQTENCYLIIESMHYKIPGEIHDQELRGRYKSQTSDLELKESFRRAFYSRSR